MRLDLHLLRLPPIAATLGFFGVIAGGPTPCLAAEDQGNPAVACAISEADAKQNAHEFVDLYLTGTNNFLLFFDRDWGPNGTKRCALEPFLAEFSSYEREKIGRSDLTYGFPPPTQPIKGYFQSKYTDSKGETNVFKMSMITVYLNDRFVALKAGASPTRKLADFLEHHVNHDSAQLFVDLFNKNKGDDLHFRASLFGGTQVNIVATTD